MLHTVFGEVVNNPFSPSGDGLLNNVFFTVNEVIAILALVYMGIISIRNFTEQVSWEVLLRVMATTHSKLLKRLLGGCCLYLPLSVGLWHSCFFYGAVQSLA
nr:hypothetical protein [Klebsiella variicola]